VYTDWWLVGIVFLNLGVRLSAPTSAAKEQSFWNTKNYKILLKDLRIVTEGMEEGKKQGSKKNIGWIKREMQKGKEKCEWSG
jgi:hypothetical protein